MEALRKLFTGFLYGAGFVAAVAAAIALLRIAGVDVWPRLGTALLGKVTGSSSRFSADQFHFSNPNSLTTSWGDVAVMGTVQNKGSATGPSFPISAELFDKEGRPIYHCSTLLKDGLRKDQQANFMIECRGAPKEIVARVASFKVYAGNEP